MKAHRFKTKLTSREDVLKEWNSQLIPRIDNAINEAFYKTDGKEKGIVARAVFKESKEGVQIIAAVKLDLMKEWERKGRNMAFINNTNEYNFMNLLSEKYWGNSLK
jgi:hypothetical protein